MIDFGYNNKKTNIKVNILLCAFLENEFHNNEICLNKINKSFKENIGIYTYIYKTDEGYYPVIAVDSNNESAAIILDKSNFTDKVICFKLVLKSFLLIFVVWQMMIKTMLII